VATPGELPGELSSYVESVSFVVKFNIFEYPDIFLEKYKLHYDNILGTVQRTNVFTRCYHRLI